MVHRTFKTLKENRDERILMKQFVIFGMFTIFNGIVPYGMEIQTIVLTGLVFVPEMTENAFYEPLGIALDSVSKPFQRKTKALFIYVQSKFLSFIRMYITTSWNRDGWIDVTRLDDEEYRNLSKSFRDIASDVFREKRRRMKIHFTSSSSSSKPTNINTNEEEDERKVLGDIRNNGVMRTPPKSLTEKKKRRRRKFGTMMPRVSKPLFGEDENEDSSSIFTEPRPQGRYVSPTKKIPIGTRVYVELSRNVVREATLRFCGKTEFYSGEWVGVELDDCQGKNDGSVQGIRYFDCAPMKGLFVRPQVISLISPSGVGGEAAVRRRLIS